MATAETVLSDLVGSPTIARDALGRYGSLHRLAQDRERAHLALGKDGARILGAALDLAALLAEAQDARLRLTSPSETARYLMPRHALQPVECFGVVLLDVRHALLRDVIVSHGCLTASLVHPREVFAPAIEERAAALVAFHNHPSGDPEPSAEDIALTRRLAAAGTLIGIELLDHIVLGAGRYVSMQERGML